MDLSVIIPIAGLVALGFAAYLSRSVLRQGQGTPEMRKISDAIHEGANAFLKRQYTSIAILAAVIAVIFAVGITATEDLDLGLKTAGAFALGAAFSALSGYLGMHMSIRANSRTANASLTSMDGAVRAALRGGAVSGLIIVALSLLGVTLIYFAYGGGNPSITADDQFKVILSIVGFAFGASLVALFAQLGGGIYTKGADVGADLVGKIEAGIPEDDPRNPAVVADLVGDNVGDCAGRGADLFESTVAENIGAMILGAVLYPYFGLAGILFPLVARSFGLFAVMAGVMTVRVKRGEDPMKSLNRGFYVATILAMVFFAFTAWAMFRPNPNPVGLDPSGSPVTLSAAADLTWLYLFLAGLVGIVTALAFVYITQYYTEARYRSVKEIAKSSETGPATNIISGFAVGLESTALPGLVIAIGILASFFLGEATLMDLSPTGIDLPIAGFYGTGIATMGMLATAAYILAMDTFGPIADNAAGIIEMAQMPEEARAKMDRLDSAGNTTKALTKGYAVGSAALAAFLLFAAYVVEVQERLGQAVSIKIELTDPVVFVGALAGVVIVFLFSALAIRAVGGAAYAIINDVRAQFKEDPGIMRGTSKPDYARSVDICTRSALREMVAPGLLAVLGPVAIGLILGVNALGATLMVGTIAGVVLALVLNTGGGAWDNAKKYIEAGAHGGKGTETHKAAVVGDTVGDPFKDTAGPSLHILVKLLATITLVLSPLFLWVGGLLGR